MVLHLPMMKILLPANVQYIFEIMFPLAQFDIFHDDVQQLFFGGDNDDLNSSFLSDQLVQLGYDSEYCIQNLKSVLLILGILVLKLLFLCVCKLIMKGLGNKKQEQKVNKSLQEMWVSEFISLALETYMEVLISGLFNVLYKDQIDEDVFSLSFAYGCLVLVYAFMPATLMYVVGRIRRKRVTERFEEKYGAFHLGINKNSFA